MDASRPAGMASCFLPDALRIGIIGSGSEQQFKELSPAQQQAVNQKIQQIMLKQLQQNAGTTGQILSISA